MKGIEFFLGFFTREKNRRSLFSEALSEGIRDAFKDMGDKKNGRLTEETYILKYEQDCPQEHSAELTKL
jgi:hypothetical protein